MTRLTVTAVLIWYLCRCSEKAPHTVEAR